MTDSRFWTRDVLVTLKQLVQENKELMKLIGYVQKYL